MPLVGDERRHQVGPAIADERGEQAAHPQLRLSGVRGGQQPRPAAVSGAARRPTAALTRAPGPVDRDENQLVCFGTDLQQKPSRTPVSPGEHASIASGERSRTRQVISVALVGLIRTS